LQFGQTIEIKNRFTIRAVAFKPFCKVWQKEKEKRKKEKVRAV